MQKTVSLILLCFLAACGANFYYGWIERVADTDQVTFEGRLFEAAFKPLGDGFCEAESGSVQVPPDPSDRSDGLICIFDYGLPIVEVSRSDGRSFSRKDYQLAESVALIACDQNPDWTPRTFLGARSRYDSDVRRGFAGKDQTPFLYEGVWSFFEICE